MSSENAANSFHPPLLASALSDWSRLPHVGQGSIELARGGNHPWSASTMVRAVRSLKITRTYHVGLAFHRLPVLSPFKSVVPIRDQLPNNHTCDHTRKNDVRQQRLGSVTLPSLPMNHPMAYPEEQLRVHAIHEITNMPTKSCRPLHVVRDTIHPTGDAMEIP